MLRPIARCFPDRPAFLLASWAFSLLGVFALNFVLLHRPIQIRLGIESLESSVWLANGLWLVLTLLLGRRHSSTRPLPGGTAASTRVFMALLALSTLMAAATYAGRLNEHLHALAPERNRQLPDWSGHVDFEAHMVRILDVLIDERLPPSKLAHRAVQISAINDAVVTGISGSLNEDAVKRAKAYALPFYFVIVYFTYLISVHQLGLSARIGGLSAVCAVLFAPISLAPLSGDYSSYRLGIAAAGTYYHNVTQLWSGAIALVGVALVHGAARSKLDAGFVLGAAFIAGSFFFKPSAFGVMAPALVLVCLLARPGEWRASLRAMFVVLLVPGFWWLYPEWFGVDKTQVDLVVAPFQKFFIASRGRLPPQVTSNEVIWASVLLLTSLAAFLPALSTRRWPRGPERARGLLEWAREERSRLFLALPMCIGVPAVLLWSDRAFTGNSNLGWGAAMGVLVAIPLLLETAVERRRRWVGMITLALIALHLCGGLQHLLYFLLEGNLNGLPW